MKITITDEIRSDKNNHTLDCTYHYPEMIVQIKHKTIYKAKFKGHAYWFGYEFDPATSNSDRTKFIHYLKGIGEQKMPAWELKQFIEYPLNELDKQINLYSVDCFIYPVSGRSPLVQRMIEIINEYTSHEIKRVSFELVKRTPADVEFDWELFESEVSADTNKYNQMMSYIKDTLMPAIEKLDYFSLAASVKPKYRRYIKNFFDFSEEDVKRISNLQGKKILIVDDINTSGSTLNEILRIVRKINPDCEIFIYNLIGNFKK